MPELIGQTLGKYRVVARLGQGGMAEVYKAYHPGLDRYVAIKVLHRHLAEDPDFIGRFEREARAVANLRHPNIVQVFDFDVEHEMYYMTMEFVGGPTLKAELLERSKQGKLFTLQETARIMVSLCGAIDYAHGHGMVHRDLKPANFMISREGQILILDFGIAKIVGATQYTMTGAMAGTPAYMSPEQGQGERGDARSDIYSLGVVLYEMVTGRVPFDADTPFAVIMKHITDPLPLPRTINPDLPEAVETIILKALSKSPDDRFQTGAEFATAFREATRLSPYDNLSRNPLATITPLPKIDELKPDDPTFRRAAPEATQTIRSAAAAGTETAPAAGQPTLQPADLKSDAATVVTLPKLSGRQLALWGGGAVALVIIAIAIALGIGSRQRAATATATADAVAQLNGRRTVEAAAAQTQTAAAGAQIIPTGTDTPTPAPTPTSGPTATPTNTPDLIATQVAVENAAEATRGAQKTATAAVEAAQTAEAAATQTAEAPTSTPTPLPTDTPPPTNTPLPLPPTRVLATPTPAATPTPPPPQFSGRIAVPVDNGFGQYEVWVYDISSGEPALKIPNARQPTFRSDGVKLLVNGEGGGRDDVWEVNAASGQLEKAVSGSPTDSHPVYSPAQDRIAYGNPKLSVGADGNTHPYIFVQCSLKRPQEEGEQTCRELAHFGILIPNGQIGEIQGSNPVWTGDDRIAFKGCNTWASGNSCGIYIVGSWANKRSSNGETPRKLPGVDGTSTFPTDAQGTLILYHALDGDNWELFLVSVNGGPTNLTNSPTSNDGLGAFSPDGQGVAFVSDRGGAWAVWAMPASGGSAAKLFDLPPAPWGTGERDWSNERISWGP